MQAAFPSTEATRTRTLAAGTKNRSPEVRDRRMPLDGRGYRIQQLGELLRHVIVRGTHSAIGKSRRAPVRTLQRTPFPGNWFEPPMLRRHHNALLSAAALFR